jgi:hypothetical protein
MGRRHRGVRAAHGVHPALLRFAPRRRRQMRRPGTPPPPPIARTYGPDPVPVVRSKSRERERGVPPRGMLDRRPPSTPLGREKFSRGAVRPAGLETCTLGTQIVPATPFRSEGGVERMLTRTSAVASLRARRCLIGGPGSRAQSRARSGLRLLEARPPPRADVRRSSASRTRRSLLFKRRPRPGRPVLGSSFTATSGTGSRRLEPRQGAFRRPGDFADGQMRPAACASRSGTVALWSVHDHGVGRATGSRRALLTGRRRVHGDRKPSRSCSTTCNETVSQGRLSDSAVGKDRTGTVYTRTSRRCERGRGRETTVFTGTAERATGLTVRGPRTWRKNVYKPAGLPHAGPRPATDARPPSASPRGGNGTSGHARLTGVNEFGPTSRTTADGAFRTTDEDPELLA